MSQAGDEEQWVAAFEKCRGVLALFTQAQSAKDLAAIKQGWLLCLGSHLCPETYPTVAADAKKGAPNKGFIDTVQAAEKSSAWPEFSQCVIARATQGGGDCDAIWDTLKVPRLEWLNAAVQVNTLRRELRSELGRARQADPMAEDTSVKSVWVYGLGHGLPRCNALALGWAKHAGMSDPTSPLRGYDEARWDVRLDTWRQLERCVIQGAEAAGTDLPTEWVAP